MKRERDTASDRGIDVLGSNIVGLSGDGPKVLGGKAKQPKMAAAIAGRLASQGSQIFRL